MRIRPTMPSPSMGVAIAALFVALGGTGYAATQLPAGHGDVQAARKSKKKKVACLATTPALCSNLKSAVDNEVARFVATHKSQLSGAPGSPGPQGTTGAPGGQGPVGPTAAFGTGAFSNPPASEGSVIQTLAVDLPSNGKLFVITRVEASVSCATAAPCTDTYALYVDGTPVPDTAVTITAGGTTGVRDDSLTTLGVTSSLPGGSHTVQLALTSGANVGTEAYQARSLDAVLVGG